MSACFRRRPTATSSSARYAQLGQYETARENFAHAIELKPNHMQAIYQLADVCQRIDRLDEAEQYRKEFQALQTAARTDLQERKGRDSELVDLGTVRRSVASTQAVAATLYRRRGRLEKARLLWVRALELDPNNAQFHADFGTLLAQAGQWTAAEQAFQKVIELAPDRALGQQHLASCTWRRTNCWLKPRNWPRRR